MPIDLSFILTVAILGSSPLETAKDPLGVARELAGKGGQLQGYTYGEFNTSQKKIDCVAFLDQVCLVVAKRNGKSSSYTDTVRAALKLTRIKGSEVQQLVEKSDSSIAGIQTALVKAGLGQKVEASQAKPGDLIQYWYKTKNGTWAGHAGIIESISSNGLATIFGSHRTTLKTRADGGKVEKSKGGIGNGPRLELTDPSRKIFLVRWK